MADKGGFRRKVTHDNFVTEKYDVIKNNLLGTYDDEGQYFLSQPIIRELIGLKKIKKSSFGNSIFCVGSLLGYGELVFELIFNSKTRNGKSADATLYLLEDVDKINGYLQNTLKTKLEDFNDEVENFIEETYSHFNILRSEEDDDDADVLERKLDDDLDNEDSFIIAKKQYSLMMEKLMEEKYLDAYGKYFTSRISTLTKLDNDFSNAVLDSFNRQYNLIQNVFLKEKNYMMLNELLDKCFEEYSGINETYVAQEQEYNEAIKPSFDNFVEHANSINEKFEHRALHLLDKDDREKVEEILEDTKEDKEKEDVVESKQSVEQMVNDIPKSTYTLSKEKEQTEENQAKQEDQEKEQQEPNVESEFIRQIMDKKNTQSARTRDTENQQENNFYSTFKEIHSSEKTSSSKIVDTSLSQQIENTNSNGEIAASSLKDRMSRLEKFKEQKTPEIDEVKKDSNIDEIEEEKETKERNENLFDVLSREKAKKDAQFDARTRKSREEIDLIAQDENQNESKEMEEDETILMTQREREELLRQEIIRNKSYKEMPDFDFYDREM